MRKSRDISEVERPMSDVHSIEITTALRQFVREFHYDAPIGVF